MKIYLASRYSRREELAGFADSICAATNHEITATWLGGESQEAKDAAALRRFAKLDRDDVARSDLLIAFTEKSDSPYGRGGRHVELGLALGLGKLVWIVGPRENIFCSLDEILQFDNFPQCLEVLVTLETNDLAEITRKAF